MHIIHGILLGIDLGACIRIILYTHKRAWFHKQLNKIFVEALDRRIGTNEQRFQFQIENATQNGKCPLIIVVHTNIAHQFIGM